VLARTAIVATGAEGAGGRNVPAMFEELPATHWAHVNDAIDLSILRGKRVGILGSGASAFDIATASIEAGATEAKICLRRRAMPTQNPRRAMENAGFLAHYPDLPDEQRWGYMRHLYTIGQPPPEPTWNKAMATPGVSVHPGTPWHALRIAADGAVRVDSDGGRTLEFDFVFAATGHMTDLTTRPELASIAGEIALWRDRFTPPPGLEEPRLERFPYLGRFGEFTEKVPGRAPWLARLFTITRGAVLSLGPVSASGSNMKYTAPRLIAGVTRQLFLDNAEAEYDAIVGREYHELADVAAVAAE
jgi:cation diffusion facilitator CzcD-associated flavoprotein CzcO